MISEIKDIAKSQKKARIMVITGLSMIGILAVITYYCDLGIKVFVMGMIIIGSFVILAYAIMKIVLTWGEE